MIGKSGERGSGISVLPAQHDDDDTVQHYVFYKPALVLSNLSPLISLSLSLSLSLTHTHTHTHKIDR